MPKLVCKECYIFILVFLLLQVTNSSAQLSYSDISSSQRAIILTETFENNNGNWITDNPWISGKLANGNYEISCKNYNQNTGLTYKTVLIDQMKDFELETSLMVLKGTGALVFGMTKDFDHYRIEISDKEKLTIIRDTPSNNRVEKLYSESLKRVTDAGLYNKLTIRKFNNSYFFFVNEQMIKQLNNINLTGDRAGFSVGLSSVISVAYLNITYIGEILEPIMADNNQSVKDTTSTSISIDNSIIDKQNIVKIQSPVEELLISWTSPSGVETKLDVYSARVKATIQSISELSNVSFYVNGVSQGESETLPTTGENGIFEAEKYLNFIPGKNSVYIIATNESGSKKSEERFFVNPEAIPPVISWGYPVSNTIVNTDQITIDACIKSTTSLRSTKIMVNGESQGDDNIFVQLTTQSDCDIKWQRDVILKEGSNSIYLIASNAAGSFTSEKLLINYQPAIAEKRIAMVFGNSEYLNGVSLKNPENDANLMEGTLKELGFDVIKRLNIGRDSMMTTIREYSKMLSSYNVALFYYAGHGLQIDGINYLIPSDAKLNEKDDCKWEAVSVSTITDEFKKHTTNTNIVILDACRNDPYRSWARGSEQGFKALGPINGTIISFATSEGSTAADGTGLNGLFTEELAKQMNISQPIESVFKNTRRLVMERSNNQQTPVEWSYLTGDFYFKR